MSEDWIDSKWFECISVDRESLDEDSFRAGAVGALRWAAGMASAAPRPNTADHSYNNGYDYAIRHYKMALQAEAARLEAGEESP